MNFINFPALQSRLIYEYFLKLISKTTNRDCFWQRDDAIAKCCQTNHAYAVFSARVNDSLVAILNSDCAASALRAITPLLSLSSLNIYIRV